MIEKEHNNNITRLRLAAREVVRQYELLHDTFSSIESISQWHILLELDTHKVTNMKSLADQLNIGKSATSRHMQQLIAKGLCSIKINPADGRGKLISLTKKGAAFVRKVLGEIGSEIRLAIDTMSKDEFITVVDGLSIYARALKMSRAKKKEL